MVGAGPEPHLVVCTATGGARGADAAAAALGVAYEVGLGGRRASSDPGGTVVLDLRSGARVPRGTLLASTSSRGLEATCAEGVELRAAARGRLLFAAPPNAADPASRASALAAVTEASLRAELVICVCEPAEFRDLLARADSGGCSALIRTAGASDRSLLALLARELLGEGIPLKAWTRPIGMVPARRALAGLEPGGESGRRAVRFAGALTPARRQPIEARLGRLRAERAQALPAILGIAALVVGLALILLALGGAATAKGRLQRSADLAALSAARSMRDDFPRLFVAATLANGVTNPAHLERAAYIDRAEAAALDAAERNGTDADLVAVRFPDRQSFAPLRVRVGARAEVQVAGATTESGPTTTVSADAEITMATAAAEPSGQPEMASGGGYGGPLAYRQGEPMRPDVAAAFDRMAAAAAADGVSLVVNSGYRSDAEQQILWDQNPDPRMVAPPGTSLHRCGTELDLGPSSAYGWLASNATRFGFLQRYSWEAWHYGYTAGPEPCSAEGESGGVAAADSDGKLSSSAGLPEFVPAAYRGMLIASASRHDVSAALLAAQIMAESNFNPSAVSPAGAQGIAQFMPATAASYGLADPFDAEQAIDAQARLMSDLLAQFGSVELALAGYNAGPGAVSACSCVPPYPETQAYVARIMALLDGAGELLAPAPVLEIRLVS